MCLRSTERSSTSEKLTEVQLLRLMRTTHSMQFLILHEQMPHMEALPSYSLPQAAFSLASNLDAWKEPDRRRLDYR